VEFKTVEALVSVGARYVGRAPTFDVEPGWWSEVEAITRHLDELLGVPTLVLRLVHADEAVIGRGGRVVYHVEALGEPRPGVLDGTPLPDWDSIIATQPLRSTWAAQSVSLSDSAATLAKAGVFKNGHREPELVPLERRGLRSAPRSIPA